MWDKILELAIGDGLWALLFCVLLIYELKDSRARENRYQDTITSLAKDLEYIKDIDEEIKYIDGDIEQMNIAMMEYLKSLVKENIEDKKKIQEQKRNCKKTVIPHAEAKESA